jgi:hypothetical protein
MRGNKWAGEKGEMMEGKKEVPSVKKINEGRVLGEG